MAGNDDDASVMVPAPPVKSEGANSIVSASAEALAVVIASRSVVNASAVVLSASELTIIVGRGNSLLQPYQVQSFIKIASSKLFLGKRKGLKAF